MTGVADARDMARGALASLAGFGGRLTARTLLMLVAGRWYGIDALGELGKVAASTEIAAAFGVLGLKRSLLDMLSADAENSVGPERRIAEALLASVFAGSVISGVLYLLWPAILHEHRGLRPYLYLAPPLTIFADVSLTAIKYKRIIRWDVGARAIAEPWGFLILAAVLFLTGATRDGLIISYVGSLFCASFISAAGLLKTYGLGSLIRSGPRASGAISTLRRSAPAGVTDVGVMALRRIDLIILGFFVGPAEVGLYYMAQQLATVPQKVNGLFEPMLSPVMARLHNQLKPERIRSNLRAVCRWVFIIQAGVSIPMMAFGGALMGIFGNAFTFGGTILSIIIIAELVDGSFASAETPLLFARPRTPPKLIVATLILEGVAIAIGAYFLGALGAALGFLSAMLFLATGRLTLVRRILGITVVDRRYLAPVLCVIATSAALFATRFCQDAGAPYLSTFLALSAVAAFVYLISRFAISDEDRRLMRVIRRRRRKPAMARRQ